MSERASERTREGGRVEHKQRETTHTHTHICTHTYNHTRTRTHTDTDIHHACMHVNMAPHAHTNTHTHTHTHTHTGGRGSGQALPSSPSQDLNLVSQPAFACRERAPAHQTVREKEREGRRGKETLKIYLSGSE